MKKKVLTLVVALALAVALVVGLVACNPNGGDDEIELPAYENIEAPDYSNVQGLDTVKVGMICLHDNSSTYDKNFIDAMNTALEELGMNKNQLILKTNIPEDARCTDAARQLVESGCNVIFADSFDHESNLKPVAIENPNVQFCHATGVSEHSDNSLPNLHNAFASIYEGRYLAGIAAGMKLNEMIEAGKFTAEQAKIGYVGAYTYAEVISGYTSFYLGARSVCPTVTMDVQFTGSWYDYAGEKTAAETLINRGCKLISQHADSMGAPSACEEKGVPNVSYNGSTVSSCPDTFIVSSRINWVPYLKHMITQVAQGHTIKSDYTGSIKDGSVVLTNLGKNASAKGTVDAIVAARTKIANGELHIFDCSKFTITGANFDAQENHVVKDQSTGAVISTTQKLWVDENGHVTKYLADANGDFAPDTDAIINGYFSESTLRSAPYFDLTIDGITLLNSVF